MDRKQLGQNSDAFFEDLVQAYFKISNQEIIDVLNKDKDFWLEAFNNCYSQQADILAKKNFLSNKEENEFKAFITKLFQKKIWFKDVNEKPYFKELLAKKMAQYDPSSGHIDREKFDEMKYKQYLDKTYPLSCGLANTNNNCETCFDVIKAYEMKGLKMKFEDIPQCQYTNYNAKDKNQGCYDANPENMCYTCTDVFNTYKKNEWEPDASKFDQCHIRTTDVRKYFEKQYNDTKASLKKGQTTKNTDSTGSTGSTGKKVLSYSCGIANNDNNCDTCVDVVKAHERKGISKNDIKFEDFEQCKFSTKPVSDKVTTGCYGARDTNDCYTCADVVKAYKNKTKTGWDFDVSKFEQCAIKTSDKEKEIQKAQQNAEDASNLKKFTNASMSTTNTCTDIIENLNLTSYSDITKYPQCTYSVKDTETKASCHKSRSTNDCYTCADVIKRYDEMNFKWQPELKDFAQCNISKEKLDTMKKDYIAKQSTPASTKANEQVESSTSRLLDAVVIIVFINWGLGAVILAYLIISKKSRLDIKLITFVFGCYGYLCYIF